MALGWICDQNRNIVQIKFDSSYCVSRSLQYILEDYEDDDLENLYMDFLVGVSQISYVICSLYDIQLTIHYLLLFFKALQSLPSSFL